MKRNFFYKKYEFIFFALFVNVKKIALHVNVEEFLNTFKCYKSFTG